MSKLEFVGTKIPSEWIQKLKQLTEETGKTQSAIVRDAIAAAIGVNQLIEVNPLRSELDDLKARVTALEEITRLSTVNQTEERDWITKVNPINPIAAVTNPEPEPIANTNTKPTVQPIARLYKCPRCGSDRYRLNGFGKLRTDGSRGQRLKCIDCDRGWLV